MSRYFFHVEDGGSQTDREGVELASITDARKQAVDLAGHTMIEGAGKFWDGQPWAVRVTDADGRDLFELHLSATNRQPR